jgi:hypothetical protein
VKVSKLFTITTLVLVFGTIFAALSPWTSGDASIGLGLGAILSGLALMLVSC